MELALGWLCRGGSGGNQAEEEDRAPRAWRFFDVAVCFFSRFDGECDGFRATGFNGIASSASGREEERRSFAGGKKAPDAG